MNNQLERKIKILRLDRGKYEFNSFSEFCEKHEIIYETTTLYSPRQNGIAERKK